MTWLRVRNRQVDHKVIFYDHGIGEAPLIPGAGGVFGVRLDGEAIFTDIYCVFLITT
jgi:predicted Rdx family selenoprotein